MARLNEPAAVSTDVTEAACQSRRSVYNNNNNNNNAADDSSWPPASASSSLSAAGATTTSSLASDSFSWSTHPDRRRLARQNRDLAKSNNWRGLRIRELETEQTYLLSQNLTLQTRILELEHELANNSARRIADHALEIKAQLEEQLGEWSAVLSGLGLEPPRKRPSQLLRGKDGRDSLASSGSGAGGGEGVGRRSSTRGGGRRSSFMRPSPSQRRLRDVALQVEELGHIPEGRSYSRMSMDSEQIRALQAQAADHDDELESPELGPPPMSRFVDDHVRLSISSPKSPSPRSQDVTARPGSPSPFSSPLDLDPQPRAGILALEGEMMDVVGTELETELETVLETVAVREERMRDVVGLEDMDVPPSPTPQSRLSPPAALLPSMSPAKSIPTTSEGEAAAPPTESAGLFAKSGTKRKFSSTNDDSGTTVVDPHYQQSDSSASATAAGPPRSKRRASGAGILRGRPSNCSNSSSSGSNNNNNKNNNGASSQEAKDAGKDRSAPLAVSRPPLAVKSTNEDVANSPVKKAAGKGARDAKEAENEKEREKKEKERARPNKLKSNPVPALKVNIPPPQHPSSAPPTTTTIAVDPPTEPEPESRPDPTAQDPRIPSADNSIPVTPSSPTPSTTSQNPHPPGTPPPAHLAAATTTEAARPSRRARTAVSYAEPNLRDKMRRPGKQLADAVTVRNVGSGSDASDATVPPLATTTAPSTVEASCSAKSAAAGGSTTTLVLAEEAPSASPLADKNRPRQLAAAAEAQLLLPSTVSTKRRQPTSSPDIYDMPASPADTSTAADTSSELEPERVPSRSKARSSRRSSAAAGDAGKSARTTTARKRASMAVGAAGSAAEERQEGEGEGDGGGASRRESRRRTMMV